MKTVRKVIIFGAGASHGAREPCPPLGKDLHSYVAKYLQEAWSELGYLESGDASVTEQIRKQLSKCLNEVPSYESLVFSLHETGQNRLLESLNLLMASALTPPINDDPRADDAFIERAGIYDRFLSRRFTHTREFEDVSFVTPNYDCLLERALCRCFHREPKDGELQCLCKFVNYRLDHHSNGIEVLKPHGSINWVADITLGDGRLAPDQAIPIVGSDLALILWTPPMHNGGREVFDEQTAPQFHTRV